MSNLRTGTTVKATDFPKWLVINEEGAVITYASTRKWAREFADHTRGERIAQATALTYTVKK
ncbi:uncharacterized protein YqjF (DUF2071 family) [Luteibacter sp. Sphag1AF]|uniref:hypothetical protein n=1 Tax=Luteibacter sp. Sphag1AF TaxID=2587031 RepID=UPI0016119487|nr:hypothetical protein [Luteibacter sp. Sphag1AF]MBB3227023.1 uncharacterized protein YqjF (DUF2071 family) [Luteibacter sp. Sphag1AF]